MSKCPHCGSEEYYVKCFISGMSQFNFRFDGKEAGNSELHTHLNYRDYKTMYCVECDKKLGIKN